MTKLVPTKLTLAANLFVVETEISKLEERKEALRAELLKTLKNQGVKSVKLEDGTYYVRAERHTLKVKDEALAWKWAEDHNSMKIDTAKAMKILRHELKTPKFFTTVKSEYLTIKRPGTEVESIA